GRFVYLWTPTAKLQFNFTAGRSLYSFQELTNSYYVSDYVTIMPVWLVGPKTTVRLKLDIADRDFRGPVVPTPVLREERINTYQLNADWMPSRGITLSAFAQREVRTSNFVTFGYASNSAGISAELKF